MKGGWRFNSGRHGWRHKTSSYRRIDVQRWQREGLLDGPRFFGWQWSNDAGEKLAAIDVKSGTTSPDVVIVSYRWRDYGTDDWEPAEYQIALTRTSGTLGGSRVWFRCPHCWHRAVHLYIAGRRLACRTCLNLAYPCQSENAAGRCHRRMAKIEERLSRKGLHAKTFDRLSQQLDETDTRLDALIGARLLALLGVEFGPSD